jgi:beta-lactamase superfamily II metal-dependent hydrolase
LIVATPGSKAVDMGNGLKFTVVGPMLPAVEKLQTEYRKWLKKNPKAQRTTASALAALADDSPTNLSSIVVLAEANGKKVLFTGDALGEKILEGLELVGLVKKGESLRVDVLKVPHHGSDRNVTPEFFERVVADDYVFSGNGENGNPERATLEMLAAARGDADYRIHLTYPVDEIDVERQKDWNTKRDDEIKQRKTKPAKKVRPEWSDVENSLAAFLDDNPSVHEKVLIVEKGTPHTIDLAG